jgi:hypothetical protein
MLIEVVGFSLLFDGDLNVGWFGRHVLPHTLGLAAAGILFTWFGLGLCVWAPNSTSLSGRTSPESATPTLPTITVRISSATRWGARTG